MTNDGSSMPVVYPLTDLVTSCQRPHWSPDGRRIVFSAFHQGGYDLYTLKDPLSHRKRVEDIPLTAFMRRQTARQGDREKGRRGEGEKGRESSPSPLLSLSPSGGGEDGGTSPPDSLVMARADLWREGRAPGEPRSTGSSHPDSVLSASLSDSVIPLMKFRSPDGEYIVNPYRLKFSPEFFAAQAAFSNFYGFSGLAQLSFSDVLGNHRLFFASDLNLSIKNSDLFAAYLYLRRKTDYGATIFHTRSFFFTGGRIVADRVYGFNLITSHPSSKFTRLELGTTLLAIDRERLDSNPFGLRGGFFTTRSLNGVRIQSRRAFVSSLTFVNDTVLYGYLAPVDGSRTRLSVEHSPAGIRFTTLSGDYRRYTRFLQDYNLVFRLAGGSSFGPNAQKFFLGGVANEINPRFAAGADVELDIGDLFFSSFEEPLRGTDLFKFAGNSFVLTNLEFRFPMIRRLDLGWPLPLAFQDIGGVIFLDVGGAFDRGRLDPLDFQEGFIRLDDLAGGYGLGIRTNVGIFILRYDVGWQTNLRDTFAPRHYFSVGTDF